MSKVNVSVTVIPVLFQEELKFGFIRRDKDDFLGDMLVPLGGKVEESDGEIIDGVRYHSIEHAAIREVLEEAGISLEISDLKYFCSFTLSDGRVIVSLYTELPITFINTNLEFYGEASIKERNDFAPGMKDEALALFDLLNRKEK